MDGGEPKQVECPGWKPEGRQWTSAHVEKPPEVLRCPGYEEERMRGASVRTEPPEDMILFL
jgi:hypothetical protein